MKRPAARWNIEIYLDRDIYVVFRAGNICVGIGYRSQDVEVITRASPLESGRL